MIICEHLNAFVARREQVSKNLDSLDTMSYTLYTLTSVCIFSILFSMFLKFANKENFLTIKCFCSW